jgi:hypothetical protein
MLIGGLLVSPRSHQKTLSLGDARNSYRYHRLGRLERETETFVLALGSDRRVRALWRDRRSFERFKEEINSLLDSCFDNLCNQPHQIPFDRDLVRREPRRAEDRPGRDTWLEALGLEELWLVTTQIGGLVTN